MDIKKTREGFADARAKRQRARELRRAGKRDKKAARRRRVGRAIACVCALALFSFLAYMVGDSDYRACIVGWAPVLMLACAIVFSFIYVQVLAHGLTFEENGSFHDCARGESLPFSISFSNSTILFAFKIEAVFFISDMFDTTTSRVPRTLSLSPRETVSLDFSTRFSHIGSYEVGLEKVVVSDFLGLFSKTLPHKRVHPVLVTPKLREIGGIDFSSDAETESTSAAKSVIADSMNYAYVRDYVPGDPLKTIHWKLSSRNPQGAYYTRLFERYTMPGVAVVLDFTAPKGADEAAFPQLFDTIVESGLSIARYARRRGFTTRITFRDRDGQMQVLAGQEQDDLCALVEQMPALRAGASEGETAADIVRSAASARDGENNIVVCSADTGAELVSAVLDARARRRFPLLVAAVPTELVDADLVRYTKPLRQLDAAEVPYMAIKDAAELEGAAL